MSTQVAFLRGINVGGAKLVPMADLRALASGLGYTGVATSLNSGNLVLVSSHRPATVERELAHAIAERFGFSVDVTVRTLAELRAALAANPFPDGDPSQVTVAFLTGAPHADVATRIAEAAAQDEPYVVGEREIYVHYGHGLGRSDLAARFSPLIGVSATVRNVRTVAKVVALAEAAEAADGP
ncbi:MAG: hypothetical protein JWP61_1291 [Friedmanniella sp.]|nr:hypothetical protein [Friedmanniella sp.]